MKPARGRPSALQYIEHGFRVLCRLAETPEEEGELVRIRNRTIGDIMKARVRVDLIRRGIDPDIQRSRPFPAKVQDGPSIAPHAEVQRHGNRPAMS